VEVDGNNTIIENSKEKLEYLDSGTNLLRKKFTGSNQTRKIQRIIESSYLI
jgi:hypothetical protein